MNCGAVIAAAGLSSRMGDFKPLLCLSEGTIIQRVVQSLQQAGADPVVVVVGYKAEAIERHLAGSGVHFVRNEAYAETEMFDSIRLGLQRLAGQCDRVFLTPGDVPLVRPGTLQCMLACKGPAVRPLCEGRPGHPLLLDAAAAAAVADYTGPHGLMGAVRSLGIPLDGVETGDPGVLLEADTPEDFQLLRSRDMELRSAGQLWPDMQVQIRKHSAILTPEVAQLLEMIDHTGSIQSACFCTHMSYSRGWNLVKALEQELDWPVVTSQKGGAARGGSALTAQGRLLLQSYQRFREALKAEAERLFSLHFPPEIQPRNP